MAQSSAPVLTSIDEEEEALLDLEAITLNRLKRLRTSGKMVHTKAGKRLIVGKKDKRLLKPFLLPNPTEADGSSLHHQL